MIAMTKRDAKELMIAKIVLVALFVFALGIVWWFAWGPPAEQRNKVDSFETCAKHNPVFLSYPAVCVTKDGHRYVEPINKSSSY